LLPHNLVIILESAPITIQGDKTGNDGRISI